MKPAADIHAELVRRIEQVVAQPGSIVADLGELDMTMFELFRLRAFVEGREEEFCEAWSPNLAQLDAKHSWDVEGARMMLRHWDKVASRLGWELPVPPWMSDPALFDQLSPEWSQWIASSPEPNPE